MRVFFYVKIINMRWIFLLILLTSFEAYGQLAVTKISDLDFGVVPQDGPAKTVPPNSFETAENASFLVTGPANTAYSIILPRRFTMDHSSGTGKSIKVDNIISFPAEGNHGFLNPSGEQYLYVGATREAIQKNLTTGFYSATFTVEVVF